MFFNFSDESMSEFPGNSVSWITSDRGDSVGEFPGNAAMDSSIFFLWVILSSPEETHVGN